MSVASSKEKILKKIRKALSSPTPLPFPQSEGNQSVFSPSRKELELQFAEAFSALLGKFSFCLNEAELVQQVTALAAARGWTKIYCQESPLRALFKNSDPAFYAGLPDCDASLTSCEFLVARTGSIVLSSAAESGRTPSVYAPVHICVAYTRQLVYDVRDALQGMKEKYPGQLPSMVSFATGPSRTADIEKTLVVGVHGPKEVYCFLVDQ